MRILMIGDVIGQPGRRAVKTLLPQLREELQLDLVIANGENTAGGFGLTLDTANELLGNGVDVITSGNHIWDQREIVPYLDEEMPILRPANYPNAPGRGWLMRGDVLTLNLMGRVFMSPLDCPFRTADQILAEAQEKHRPRAIIVDFHAEATSEKQALGWYLDGRVSVVAGTHTHVATADARLLPKGTAYITDLGMTGPINSVIGFEPGPSIARIMTSIPQRLNVGRGPLILNSALVEIDLNTGKAVSIQRVDRMVN